jgi:hypothetical protein
MRRLQGSVRIGMVSLAAVCAAIAMMLPGLTTVSARAQTVVTTPKPASAERKAIMDALRFPVSTELKQKVIFVVNRLKLQRGYAFVNARPEQPNGKAIDYSKTQYAEAIKNGAFDDVVTALLKKKGKQWHVLTYNIGATDVVWEDWDKKYGAPPAIFK